MLEAAGVLPALPEQISARQKAARWASFTARVFFAAVVISIPLRYRITVLARPVPAVYDVYTDFLFFPTDAAMLLTLASWLISQALAPRRLKLGPRHIWIPLAALTAAGMISVASSYDAALSLYHAIRLVALFWFYLFVVNELTSPAWILIPAGVQIASQSIIALAQFIAQRSVGLQWLGELPLNPALTDTSVVVAGGLRLLRAYGLTDHPNILGGCLAFGLVLLLPSVLRWPAPPAAFSVFISAGAALLVSFSRAGWLAFLLGAAFVAGIEFINRRREVIKPLLSLSLACLILLASFVLAYRQFFGVRLNAGNSFSGLTPERQSIGERVLLINSALPLLQQHPLLGIGLGVTPLALKAYYPSFSLGYEPPHWALFDAALETGVLGGSSYLALLTFPVLVYIRRGKALMTSPLITVSLALLLSIGLVGFFDYYTWLLVPGRTWQWLAWGLWGFALQGGTA